MKKYFLYLFRPDKRYRQFFIFSKNKKTAGAYLVILEQQKICAKGKYANEHSTCSWFLKTAGHFEILRERYF